MGMGFAFQDALSGPGIKPPALFFDGSLDEITLWTAALSAADVAAIEQNGLPTSTTNFQAHWKLDEGSGQSQRLTFSIGTPAPRRSLANLCRRSWKPRSPRAEHLIRVHALVWDGSEPGLNSLRGVRTEIRIAGGWPTSRRLRQWLPPALRSGGSLGSRQRDSANSRSASATACAATPLGRHRGGVAGPNPLGFHGRPRCR